MLSSATRMIRPVFRSAVALLTLSATLVGAAAQQSSAPPAQPRPAQGGAAAPTAPATPPQGGAGAAQQPAPRGTQPPQDPNAPPTQPTFRTDINFVRVDAIVSDRQGRPVADLRPEDFEVLEDGKPQSIETFKLIRVDGNPPPGEAAPREINSIYAEESEARRDDVRLFVIFFDDYHVRLGASLAVKEPLVKFIETQVGPLDMIAMMYPLDPAARRELHAQQEGGHPADPVVAGPQVSVHPAPQHLRGAVRQLPGERGREDPQPGEPLGAARPDDPPRGHARGPQDGHRGERGLHRLRAAAVARQQRPERHPGARHERAHRRRLGRPGRGDERGPHPLLRRHGHPHADA